jgi:preprotein translocase subunit Sec63
VFDPYVVLGVPRDASRDEIQAAYQGAKAKYDPDQVAHLSAEVQEHFKAKAQEVDRAHQKLTE